MQTHQNLAGRLALISGASRSIGIGAAIARELAAHGAHIFTTYYRPFDSSAYTESSADDAGAILAELRGMGVKAAGLEADLADPSTPAAVFDHAEAAIGPVDI